MPINLPLNALQEVGFTSLPVTGGTEYTTKLATSDATGQFISVVHTNTIVGQAMNSAMTVALYGGRVAAPVVATLFPKGGSFSQVGGWTTPVGSFRLSTYTNPRTHITIGTAGVLSVGANGENAAAYNTGTFQNDHTVETTFVTNSQDSYMGPAVRMSPDGLTYYGLLGYGGSKAWSLFRVVNGVYTNLFFNAASTTGTVLRLTIIGTTLTVFSDGKLVATVQDATITSGAPGIVGWLVNNSPFISEIAIYEAGLIAEETIYQTANLGTVDSSGRLPLVLELSTDTTPNTTSYLASGGTNPAAGLTKNIDIANAILKAKGVIS